MSEQYDVLIIGAGPGGYVCAIKAAQLGLKVACIEKEKTLGGVCLNVGCIPSKSLLHATKKYMDILTHAKEWGITAKSVTCDVKTMIAKKDKVVSELTQGIDYLFKKNKVTSIQGEATFVSPTEVKVKDKTYTAKNIVIATGSSSAGIPNVKVDEKVVLSSTGALSLTKVPKKMVVIGGGYIGLEMGSVWQRLGADVTVVEYADTIVPAMDQEVAKELKKQLEKQGIKFKLATKVTKVDSGKSGAKVTIEPKEGGKTETVSVDVVLVSVGRKPNTDNLGLDTAKVDVDDRGVIKVDKKYKTSTDGIYAIGDVIPGPMLAHKAEEEGVAVAEILAGQAGHVDYDTIPAVIYTYPEVASVGKTEEDLKKDNVDYKVGKFPFMANSRAKAVGDTIGFVKLLADKKTDRILGAHIISADAGTLITEVTLGMEYKASAEDIARTCHPHPTTSEAVKEAALAAYFKAIHI